MVVVLLCLLLVVVLLRIVAGKKFAGAQRMRKRGVEVIEYKGTALPSSVRWRELLCRP
jgi:hypothetical protein